MKLFRIGHLSDRAGMWYSSTGDFTGKMHSSSLANRKLKMDYDAEVAGNLSVCESLTDLLSWFPLSDIQQLYAEGYCLMIYENHKPKWYQRFKHYLIPATEKPAVIVHDFAQLHQILEEEKHEVAV